MASPRGVLVAPQWTPEQLAYAARLAQAPGSACPMVDHPRRGAPATTLPRVPKAGDMIIAEVCASGMALLVKLRVNAEGNLVMDVVGPGFAPRGI